jgi:hypothetical protein
MIPGAAFAQTPGAQAADKPERADALKALVDCRQIADPGQRLACYDQAAANLDAAEAKGDVVVVDRSQVRQARRAAFGFNFQMPSFMTRGERVEELDRIESTIASSRFNSQGKLVVELEDGAIWVQIDSERLRKAPSAGTKVELRTASLGSYFMKIQGLDTVRAKRQN